MCKLKYLIVIVAGFATCLISGLAFAANASAFVAIDWSTLEIEIIGDGALIPTDDPFVSNHAYITDEHLHTLSSEQHVLLPAIAAHPFYDPTVGIAVVDEEYSSAAARAGFGSAFAASNAGLSFATVGWGTALVTVGYGLTTAVDSLWSPDAFATSSVELQATAFSYGYLGESVFDSAEIVNFGQDPEIGDGGYLALLFDFSEAFHPFVTIDGTALAAAVGTLSMPVPASLPLLLSALGLVGLRMRNTPDTDSIELLSPEARCASPVLA